MRCVQKYCSESMYKSKKRRGSEKFNCVFIFFYDHRLCFHHHSFSVLVARERTFLCVCVLAISQRNVLFCSVLFCLRHLFGGFVLTVHALHNVIMQVKGPGKAMRMRCCLVVAWLHILHPSLPVPHLTLLSHHIKTQPLPKTAFTAPTTLLHRRRRLGTSSIILSLLYLASSAATRATAGATTSAFLPTNSNRVLHPSTTTKTASRLPTQGTFATVPHVCLPDLDKTQTMDYARAMTDTLEQSSLPLRNDRDLDPLLESIGDKRFVFLGEASHGTHEFYTWRAHITKRLIEEKGFNFVAVEGDWPDCYELNRYIKGFKDAAKHPSDVMKTYFKRWPVWMWGNWEVAALAGWMRQRNLKKTGGSMHERVGFYGLDVYSLLESLEAILAYMRDVDGEESIKTAERALACFERVAVMGKEDVGQAYGMAATLTPYSCRNEVVKLLVKVREEAAKLAETKPHDDEAAENSLSAELNTKVGWFGGKGGRKGWEVLVLRA